MDPGEDFATLACHRNACLGQVRVLYDTVAQRFAFLELADKALTDSIPWLKKAINSGCWNASLKGRLLDFTLGIFVQ
jgi:hypothetical protein